MKDARDLARKIGAMSPGTSVKLSILRKGEPTTVSLTVGEMTQQRQADASDQSSPDKGAPRLGLTLAPASDVGGAGDQGVAVTAVDPDGPAAEHGIKTGDVILDIAGKKVSKPEDVRRELTNMNKDGKHTVLMRVKTGNDMRFVAVPLRNA